MSKKALRTCDLIAFALFTHLATVSYAQTGISGGTFFYTLAAVCMAAVIVVKTD